MSLGFWLLSASRKTTTSVSSATLLTPAQHADPYPRLGSVRILAPAALATAAVSLFAPLSTTMTSEMTSRGTRATTEQMTGASSSAGMIRVARTVGARGSAGSEHGGAGAAGLEELPRRGRGPLEIDGLAAHEGAVRI